jgi:NADPH2:quinone reductase
MIEAQAVRITGKGGPEVLSIGSIQVRDPGPGELLVKVAAAGLNRADILQRRGFYPAPAGVAADVPGLEFAGTVEQVGEGVRDFAPGDGVMAVVAGGAMATYAIVHAREALRVPNGLPLTEAAAIPEVFLTAFDGLFEQARLRMGESALLHAVGSGVGTAALQLALAVGARVIGTSRSADKLTRCQALGSFDGVQVGADGFATAVAERTAGRGCDVILDLIGAAYLDENVKALATRGRLVSVGLLGGASAPLALGPLMAKRARIIGTVLRSRPLEEKAALAQDFSRQALPLFASGKLKPVLDVIMPMQEIRAAHARMESDQTFGKVVLRW